MKDAHFYAREHSEAEAELYAMLENVSKWLLVEFSGMGRKQLALKVAGWAYRRLWLSCDE